MELNLPALFEKLPSGYSQVDTLFQGKVSVHLELESILSSKMLWSRSWVIAIATTQRINHRLGTLMLASKLLITN